MNINSIRQQFQMFKSGKVNIQKADLTALKSSLGTSASKASTGIDALLGSFDQIDTNKDGISFQELKGAVQSAGGGGGSGGADSVQGASGGKQCVQCRGCGKCSSGLTVDPSQASALQAMQIGGTQSLEKTQPHGGGKNLRPVTIDDLTAYQAQLTKDGKAVPKELTELITNFETIDANKDGKVNFGEFKLYDQNIPVQPANRDQPLQPVQADVSGVTKDDLTALKTQISQQIQESLLGVDNLIAGFDTADINKDGKINAEEFKSFLQSQAQAQVGSGNQPKSVSNGLDIFAMFNQKSAQTVSDNQAQTISQTFLQRLAANYGAKLGSAGGSLHVSV